MWDKFLKSSARGSRTEQAGAATIVTDCVDVPSQHSVEVDDV